MIISNWYVSNMNKKLYEVPNQTIKMLCHESRSGGDKRECIERICSPRFGGWRSLLGEVIYQAEL